MAGKRGFGSMSKDKQREVASMGGRAAHDSGVAHEFSPEEARAAGRKGGVLVSRDRAYMAEIGRRGGKRRAELHRERMKQEEARSEADLVEFDEIEEERFE